ncbi:hypothetical protein KC367_g119 [Hortaea werneckii]|nr:hypothetical protein KC367_g119 [Hortaea werneckii]
MMTMLSSAIWRRSLSQDVTEAKVLRRVMSKTSRAPEAPRKGIASCVSAAADVILLGVVDEEEGLLMLYSRLAGGPTGTIREPNSTPILSSSAWSVLREI